MKKDWKGIVREREVGAGNCQGSNPVETETTECLVKGRTVDWGNLKGRPG